MKECKECKVKKESSDFYGVQRECKECTKKRVKLREEKLRQDPIWLEKEKERHRDKYHRLEYKEKHKPTPEKKKEIMERYNSRYPEKRKAKNISQDLKPLVKGNEFHHWNYNIEFAKDVIELTPKDHAKIHRFIKYDQKTFMYKDLNGNLLDTREKHEELINKVLENF